MPLPFKLDHVNLWLLEDGDQWTVIDTGIDCDETRAAWERIAATHLNGKPVRRVIATHFHPDHVGLAGWLVERFSATLWMPLSEWAMAQVLSRAVGDGILDAYRHFYQATGFGSDLMALVDERSTNYARQVTPIPFSVRRIEDRETISVGGRNWQAILAGGHAFEHASFHCEELGILIAGDQILPQITPNVSVWPSEPKANPLRHFLADLDKFRGLPAGTLVLPGHRRPFTGLSTRLDELAQHHEERLQRVEEACRRPAIALEISQQLFEQKLDSHQLFFAIGETLAHLHFLIDRGRIQRTRRKDGVYVFSQEDSEGKSAPFRLSEFK